MRRTASAVLVALATAVCPLAAQDALLRGLDLERQGRNEAAAAAFRQVLARDPLNSQALLGAERVYTALGHRDSIMALVRATLEADAQHVVARTIEVRTARATGGNAMAAAALARWMAAAPMSEAPHRELVRLLLSSNRTEDARAAVESARVRLRDPERLRPEMAQVEAQSGNWPRAAAEWRAALVRRHDLQPVAAFSLQAAPPASRDRLLRALTGPDTLAAPRRLAAELLLGWGEPARSWQMLRAALPAGREERVGALRVYADRARSIGTEDAQRVAAAALEMLASMTDAADAARYRIESARAFADAGDAPAARRVLRAMVEDDTAPSGVAAAATSTLVEVYVREGNIAEAATLLDRNSRRLAGSERERLAMIVARGWVASGRLDRAEEAVSGDSSLAADEVRGWIALYRGRLDEASDLLRSAGARGGERERGAERAAAVALAQAVQQDSFPALGEALYLVARGDTLRGGRALADLARRPGARAAAELLAHAARLLAARDPGTAEALWSEIIEQHADAASAPAALLAVARARAARGDVRGAQTRLEMLILRHPGSALVPEARRELDRVRGLVPRS